jgi:hypothetical protein
MAAAMDIKPGALTAIAGRPAAARIRLLRELAAQVGDGGTLVEGAGPLPARLRAARQLRAVRRALSSGRGTLLASLVHGYEAGPIDLLAGWVSAHSGTAVVSLEDPLHAIRADRLILIEQQGIILDVDSPDAIDVAELAVATANRRGARARSSRFDM